MKDAPLIDVEGIEKTFGEGEGATHALRGVSFSISEGEFVAVMGPSGSGKSTLLHILSLLDKPTKGVYRFRGKDATTYSDDELAHIRHRELGFVFQQFNLLAGATVLGNVLLPLTYTKLKRRERVKEATAVIERVGLAHRIDHLSNELSGGEKQRVAFARALVLGPSVIFADEPTGNLDSVSGEQVMSFLQDLNKTGRTIILVTHETYTAEHAKRIIHMRDGQIESDTRTEKRRIANGEFHAQPIE